MKGISLGIIDQKLISRWSQWGSSWALKWPRDLAVRRKNYQKLAVGRRKKLTVNSFSGDHNGKIVTVSRNLDKILTVSRKSYHLIETLFRVMVLSRKVIGWKERKGNINQERVSDSTPKFRGSNCKKWLAGRWVNLLERLINQLRSILPIYNADIFFK